MSLADYTAEGIRNSAPKFLKGQIDNTIRGWFLATFLKEAKRIKFKDNSHTINWNVKCRRPAVYTSRGQRPQFVQSDNNVQLSINRARFESVDKIDRDTMAINQGETQIVNLAETKVKDLVSSMFETLATAIYGDASADSTLLAGLDTIFQGTVTDDNDKVAVPSSGSVYGGRSMVLGANGGTWSYNLGASGRYNTGISADWPEGSGDPQYDYLAPKMLNYTGAWSATKTWAAQCEMLLRRALVFMNALGGEGSAPGLHMLALALYTQFQDALVGRERLYISDYAKNLGFPGTLEFEGAMVRHDFACPAGVGYSLNVNQMELSSVYEDLFFLDGPTWSIEEQAYLMLSGFHGNIRYNPKYFVKHASYTA